MQNVETLPWPVVQHRRVQLHALCLHCLAPSRLNLAGIHAPSRSSHWRLTHAHPCPLPMRSGTDCVRAIAAGLSSAPCVCENSSPYLHCHALAAKEAASKIQSTLAEADVLVDAGERGCRSARLSLSSLAPEQRRGYVAALTAHLPLLRCCTLHLFWATLPAQPSATALFASASRRGSLTTATC